ncbi:hypothetical protein H4582DRAFT_2057691 [Lactarius indigo]|nr:hypothetical protein H4582DRAFT_2057691 [Lactarius indigo]
MTGDVPGMPPSHSIDSIVPTGTQASDRLSHLHAVSMTAFTGEFVCVVVPHSAGSRDGLARSQLLQLLRLRQQSLGLEASCWYTLMSEDPLAIAKEAKALQQGLKDLLKNRDPWNKEVEFQRRKRLTALISIYKTRIAALEHALREAGIQRQHPRAQRPGPVEHRRLVQRFKQFLSTEEKFWTQLVIRIQRQFALSEARSALATLSITADAEPDSDGADAGKHDHFRFPPEPAITRALHDPVADPERGGRNTRGRGSQTDQPRAKTYDKARACYECARDLMPDEGNASHQLAILASYQGDTFESLVQYYKALPGSAKERANLDRYHPMISTGQRLTLRPSRTMSFLLHALWRLDVEEMDSIAPKHDEAVVKEFSELVSDRVLPIDTITKVIIAAQGALWKHRKVSASASVSMESRIASHVLALHRALLQSGIMELDEAAKIVEEDLAMRITATFRRTLPALRIASRWLRVNLDYVLGDTRKDISKAERGPVISDISKFWEAYTSFATRIVLVFPPTSLPKLKRALEEDFDTRGYLPLGGLLTQEVTSTEQEGQDLRALEQVHPNEEQLMRIWDIGHDARLIAEIPGTQMETFRAQFSLIDSVREDEAVDAQEDTGSRLAADDRQLDDDARTETTDPVGDAFREVLGVSSSDDEQDDEIVWNPRTPGQPSGTSKTTAQDLLNNVMGLGRPAHKADVKSSFPPHFSQQQPLHSPPQTLFSGGAGPSIWSAAPGESALGLSPRHQANVTLPASPLTGLVPIGHTSLQAAVPGIPSTTHVGVPHLGSSSSVLPPSTHGLWPPYDHMEKTLPTNTSQPPAFPALIERNHRRIPSPSVGLNDGYTDSGFQGSVVYASSPRQAPLPANASSTCPIRLFKVWRRAPTAYQWGLGRRRMMLSVPWGSFISGEERCLHSDRTWHGYYARVLLARSVLTIWSPIRNCFFSFSVSRAHLQRSFLVFHLNELTFFEPSKMARKKAVPYREGYKLEARYPKKGTLLTPGAGPRCRVDYNPHDDGPWTTVQIMRIDGDQVEEYTCAMPRYYAVPLILINKRLAFFEAQSAPDGTPLPLEGGTTSLRLREHKEYTYLWRLRCRFLQALFDMNHEQELDEAWRCDTIHGRYGHDAYQRHAYWKDAIEEGRMPYATPDIADMDWGAFVAAEMTASTRLNAFLWNRISQGYSRLFRTPPPSAPFPVPEREVMSEEPDSTAEEEQQEQHGETVAAVTTSNIAAQENVTAVQNSCSATLYDVDNDMDCGGAIAATFDGPQVSALPLSQGAGLAAASTGGTLSHRRVSYSLTLDVPQGMAVTDFLCTLSHVGNDVGNNRRSVLTSSRWTGLG